MSTAYTTRANYANFYPIAVDFATGLQNIIEYENRLPVGCTLDPRDEDDEVHWVRVNCVHPQSIHASFIIISIPYNNDNYTIEEGYAKISCSIYGINGYFITITVNNRNEMYEAITFYQNLLQYQPNDEVERLRYIRVPNQLLDHWCVTPHLREVNINPPEPILPALIIVPPLPPLPSI
jgi:hypothetical protein